eukprot:SAG11_NODE_1458_length_4874_cov_218.142827_2_plen_167_part_00
MPISKKDMLSLLEATDFPKNKGRTNNLQPGQTYSRSMVLGKVRQLYTSCDGKVCKVPSKKNEKYPILLKAAKQFLKQHDKNYKFESVTINKNQQSSKHIDKNNSGKSYIIGLGNYTGGELVFSDKKSPYYGKHNIKNKWLKFVGDTEHYNTPFKGTRYTLVYYHLK